jgi:hypothetical protein
MRLELTLEEALAFQRAAAPLPPEVERVTPDGDAILIEVNPREHLPRLLQGVHLTLTVRLLFQGFADGVAQFRVTPSLRGLPITSLTQLLLKLVAVPALEGVRLETREGELVLLVDAQRLLARRVGGLTLTDFAVAQGRVFVEASVGDLRLPTGGPA